MKLYTFPQIFVIIAVVLFTGKYSNAQQISILNMHNTNPFAINPSKAGLTGNTFFLHHRNQWIDIQGAPEFSLLTTEWRIKDSKSAIGFTLSHDKTNILQSTFAGVTYASHFKVGQNQRLSFGISLGVKNNTIMFDRLQALEPGDEILFDNNQSGINIDASFGVSYISKKFEVQVAAIQLPGNSSEFVNNFENKTMDFTFFRHYFVSAGYQLFPGKIFRIKPIVQIVGVEGLAFQPQGVLQFDFRDVLTVSGHYLHNRGLAFSTCITVKNTFEIGYSTEFQTNQLSGYTGGIHELVFGIRFGKPFEMGKQNQEKTHKKRNKEYEERLEFLMQQNELLEQEIEDQKKIVKELEENMSKMNYEEIQELLKNKKEETR